MARDRIEGYKPHAALQRDFSLKAKPFLKEHGIDYDSKGYQTGGMFKVGSSNYWYDPDEEGFFTDKPDFEGYPYDEIVDLLKDTLGLNEPDGNVESEDVSDGEQHESSWWSREEPEELLDKAKSDNKDMSHIIDVIKRYGW